MGIEKAASCSAALGDVANHHSLAYLVSKATAAPTSGLECCPCSSAHPMLALPPGIWAPHSLAQRESYARVAIGGAPTVSAPNRAAGVGLAMTNRRAARLGARSRAMRCSLACAPA